MEEQIIFGKIISQIKDGSKRINKGYTYNYYIFKIKSGEKQFSVIISQDAVNKFGYIPKLNDWVKIKGFIFKANDSFENGTIKKVKEIKHIDPQNLNDIF